MENRSRRFTAIDRVLIALRLVDGWGVRAIARVLGRSAGTISGEISRHGGASGYAAPTAHTQAAASLCLSGRKPRLAQDSALFRALYALPRGELRRELLSYLRQAKPMRGRKPKGSERRGNLVGMTNIKERPEEIEGRLLPGHWEGGLIPGMGGASAIGTLVERTTRFVVLVHMATRRADVAASAFAGALNAIPAPLRQTMTYDQRKEMSQHQALASQTGMRIFFADPHSPWQRGSNENTVGLLRQHLPKRTSFAGLDQSDLDLVATSLNDRPRKALDYATPNEAFNKLVAGLAGREQVSILGVRCGT